ncbi:DUF1501 domain-containing protein [Gimesia chilikensis]|uniref:DUF1501 domain-containing protein n=1 Tax=Gimesia chilikensis TaxID=2605989 RepID=A0A517PJ72_9PLAN|nr:DUF1501 domain-containing protein [Gimesia chilikensis]QDT19426.1 hypothetical protein HG66A1_11910 [Gimesia chilikensis]
MVNHSFSRRTALKNMALGVTAWSTSSWLPALADVASATGKKPKSVILIWLNGGPSTIDLWDLKPGNQNGGPFRKIDTKVPGMQISEHLPGLAAQAADFSLIRSMSTREGDHSRARFVSMTGYTPQGAIKFPAFGSLVAHEFNVENDIPAYVHIGGRPAISGGGFLGPQFAPFVVGGRSRRRGPDNADLKVADLAPVSPDQQAERLQLQSELASLSTMPTSVVTDALNSARDRALRLMNPQAASVFNLEEEQASVREAYGSGSFGQGCLMARRLVERGVSFVEVSLNGWDTHSNNFERVKELSQQLDRGCTSLLNDLRERGLLKDTLVVCQGEFGRTPRINGQDGRDHWPASWAMMLAGAGIRGGQVIGETSADGAEIKSKPTRTADLMATIFRGVGLDPRKQNMSNVGRPIRLADPDGTPLEELL